MTSALKVASYFAHKAAAHDESDLTNLKLQKLLFFAQTDYYKTHQKALFDESIEAWSYGPVIRNVYDRYKVCGAFPISYFELDEEAPVIEAGIKKFLDDSYNKWNRYSSTYLVGLSHKSGGPWSKHYQTIDPVIPVEELVNVTTK